MEKFQLGKLYNGFELIKNEYIDDISGDGFVFEHKKSGARLVFVKTEDDNKVFFITFKTPPVDSCGTAHIMEHSVLCGSEKYPAKDPFNELAKGSLNTYLNALTYSDKTMYPVASRNESDFQNLMKVYIDAVFAPNVLKEKKLFMQEGHHLEMEDENSPLIYNGVVYNEMKGALSSPDRVLNNCINKSLFGDTVYGFESGGDPDEIVKLTYDGFKDFYNKYYHPSNSYIYFYGDMDIEKYLKYIDDEYLSKFDRKNIDSEVKEIKAPFQKESLGYYSVSKGEKRENDSLFALNFVVGKSTDLLFSMSMDVLTYILFDTNASPVKKALIDSGICEEVEGWYDNTTYQCVLNIVGKNCRKEDKEKFISVVRGALEDICNKGIDKKQVISALNYWEFMLREADYGYRPKGLAYGMNMMKGYLHGSDPIECLKIWKHFDVMREGAENGYFENIIKKAILENDFSTFVEVRAKEGMQAEADRKEKEYMEQYKKSLSPEEIKNIIEETKALKKFQQTPDSEEVINKVPIISIDQIDKTKDYAHIKEENNNIIINGNTSQIVYTKAVFRGDSIEKDKLCYMGLLENLVGKLDTAKYTYEELSSEINMYTGGIEGECISFTDENKKFVPAFAVNGKALFAKRDKLFELMEEIILTMKYNMKESIVKIIKETKGRMERRIDGSGHVISYMKALARCKNSSAFGDLTSGIGYYHFILWADENIDTVCKEVEEVAKKLFTKENVIMSFYCDKENTEEINNLCEKFKESLPEVSNERFEYDLKEKVKKEAFVTSSKVSYNSMAADFKQFGYEYSGKMRVIKNIVNTEYLWNEVRVKGGAYGCGCNVLRNGSVYTYSYRDPNISSTYNAYGSISEFLNNVTISDRDMTKYILGAVNEIDKPKSMQTYFDVSVSEYLNNITPEKKQKERDELLSANKDDLKYFADLFKKAFEEDIKITIGNESTINDSKDLFDNVRSIKEAVKSE